jgi:kynurenine formamidase
MKIVDLSKPIQYNSGDPWFMKVKIKHKSHAKSKWLIRALGLPFRLFPSKFQGWADDTIQKMGVHSTTHLDAPWHYGPQCEGKKAKTIDEVPLEWCYGDGVVIDMSHKNDFEPITRADLEKFVQENEIEIKDVTIVLIRTGRDKLMGTKAFAEKGTGVDAEATRWLLEQGVKVTGIDQWGWDLPLKYLIKKAKETNDPELFWQGHVVGIDKEYCHLEQLTNLGALPLKGFKVVLFPLKIVGASAAPARVVAILEE